MKKFASLVLALVMCMSLATTAFASNSVGDTVIEDSQYSFVLSQAIVGTEERYVWGKTITIYLVPTGTVVSAPADRLLAYSYLLWEGDVLAEPDLTGETMTIGGDNYYNDEEVYYIVGSTDDPYDIIGDEDDEFFGLAVATSSSSTVPADSETSTGTETPAASETPATTPDSYTAVKYDTWGQIALNHYGSYGAWKQLYKANNYAKLTEGTVVTLPETLGKYTRIGAPVAGEGETLYTVKAGDTLGNIAKSVYGDVMKYKAIFERNTDRLKNANTIYEGQIIVLPAK